MPHDRPCSGANRSEQADTLRTAKIDVDENPETPARFGVSGIPTMILFQNGKPAERIVGFRPKPQLLAILQRHLRPAATQRPDAHRQSRGGGTACQRRSAARRCAVWWSRARS